MRRFLNLTTVVCIVLLILIVACWVRSYYVRDIIGFGTEGGRSHTLQSILGRVHLISNLNVSRTSGDTFYSSDRLSPNAIWNGGMSGYPVKAEWHFGCVFQHYSDYHMPYNYSENAGFTTLSRLVVVPYWWMVILISIFPAVRLAQVAGERRRNSRTTSCPASTDMHNKTSEPSVAPA